MRFAHISLLAATSALGCVGGTLDGGLGPAENVNLVTPGMKRLRLVGTAYSGAPIVSRPAGISCNGGDGPGCAAEFPEGSRIELTYPTVIAQNDGSWDNLQHYYCEGDVATTVTGSEGRNEQTLFLSENMDCTAYYGRQSGNLLEIVGSAYAGAPIVSQPSGITCYGGGGPGCLARFPDGSRVEVTFPPTITAQGASLSFKNYFCQGDRTTSVTGASGRRTLTLFVYENFRCTAYYD